MSVVHAGVPAICRGDLSDTPFPVREGSWSHPKQWVDRALRPGLLRAQEDICRCVPRRRRLQPAEVSAQLRIDPNAGQMTVRYSIEPPLNPQVSQMLACMGQPKVTFEPIAYNSDIVYTDGREEVIRYPLRLVLKEEGDPSERAKRQK